MINKKIKLAIGVTALSMMLVGCGEKKQQKIIIKNFDIVDTYEYDKVKVVVEEEKTPLELAAEVLTRELGLEFTDTSKYAEYGISTRNGVFVNAAIIDGPEIPKTSAFSNEEARGINSNSQNMDAYMYDKFKEVQNTRQRKVSTYNEEEVLQEAAKKIQAEAQEQKQRIEAQKVAKGQQDELKKVEIEYKN